MSGVRGMWFYAHRHPWKMDELGTQDVSLYSRGLWTEQSVTGQQLVTWTSDHPAVLHHLIKSSGYGPRDQPSTSLWATGISMGNRWNRDVEWKNYRVTNSRHCFFSSPVSCSEGTWFIFRLCRIYMRKTTQAYLRGRKTIKSKVKNTFLHKKQWQSPLLDLNSQKSLFFLQF